MAGVFVEGVELQREGDRQVVAQGGAAAQVGGPVDWYPSMAVTQSWSRYQLLCSGTKKQLRCSFEHELVKCSQCFKNDFLGSWESRVSSAMLREWISRGT